MDAIGRIAGAELRFECAVRLSIGNGKIVRQEVETGRVKAGYVKIVVGLWVIGGIVLNITRQTRDLARSGIVIPIKPGETVPWNERELGRVILAANQPQGLK